MSLSRDRRRQYRGSRESDASCRCGSCPRCQANRQHATQQRIEAAEATREGEGAESMPLPQDARRLKEHPLK